MTESELRGLFDELCREHGLTGWTLVFNPWMIKGLGVCRHNKKQIDLSERMVADLPERAPKTLRHELAHAIAGPGAGHGPLWKEACILVGAEPKRLAAVPQSFIEAGYKYKAACPECGVLPGGWVGKPNPGRFHKTCGRTVRIVATADIANWSEVAAAADNPREPDRESETYKAHMERIKRLRDERRKA